MSDTTTAQTEPAATHAGFRCKAVIFDLDGTLVDSAADIAAAVDRVLADLGLAAAGEARVRRWVGMGVARLMERALRHGGIEDAGTVERAVALFGERYARDFRSRSALYPDVAETLALLRDRGLPLAVCTNKPRQFTLPLLQHLGIAGFFAAVTAGDDLPTRKPDAAPLLFVARALEVGAGDCLMVGDSKTDVAAARAAGMPVVAVSYGYNEGLDIRDSGPDRVIDGFRQLPALIV